MPTPGDVQLRTSAFSKLVFDISQCYQSLCRETAASIERSTMSFTDPQSITVNAVAKSMPRISTEGTRSVYMKAEEDFKMTISHQTSRDRTRRMVRVDQRVVATNPLDATSEYKTLGVYLVIDEPEYGFSDTEIDYLVQALKTWASTANVLKVCGNEH